MSLTGYLNEQNVDLINVFESINTIDTNITSGPSGLQISVLAGNTGPLNFQTNGTGATSQNINITSTGNIYLSPTQTPSISITNTGITLSPNGTTSLTTNASTVCSRQFNYGSFRVLTNLITSGTTITLNSYDSRNIFIENNVNFNLKFPSTPPDGTTFRIIKVPSTFTSTFVITLKSDTTTTFVDKTNAIISEFATSNTVYECTYLSSLNKWFCSSY